MKTPGRKLQKQDLGVCLQAAPHFCGGYSHGPRAFGAFGTSRTGVEPNGNTRVPWMLESLGVLAGVLVLALDLLGHQLEFCNRQGTLPLVWGGRQTSPQPGGHRAGTTPQAGNSRLSARQHKSRRSNELGSRGPKFGGARLQLKKRASLPNNRAGGITR